MTLKSNPSTKIYPSQKVAMQKDKGASKPEGEPANPPAEKIESPRDKANARGDVGFNMYT